MIYNNCGVLVSGSLGRRKSYERGGLAMAKKEMYNIQHTEKHTNTKDRNMFGIYTKCVSLVQRKSHEQCGPPALAKKAIFRKLMYKYTNMSFFLAVVGHFIILATVGHVGDLGIDCNCLRYFSAFCKHQLHGIHTCLILPADAC